jgi:radical SAM protein with 4Fe4S-binding SPASM domain
MTLSEFSLPHLAENIKFVHSLGFKEIGGVNLAEGNFDWSNEEYIKIMIPQLEELVEFYVENDTLEINQMLDLRLDMCEAKNREKKKWCGIGTGTIFFDTDGKRYPCAFITPMSFSETELHDILTTDFKNESSFVDEGCFSDCYVYPICPTCSGSNYQNYKSFNKRDKNRCRIQKLIAIFAADLQAKRIVKNPDSHNEYTYNTIEAIKKIRELYLPEFSESENVRT